MRNVGADSRCAISRQSEVGILGHLGTLGLEPRAYRDTYGGPRVGAVSYERGAPVSHATPLGGPGRASPLLVRSKFQTHFFSTQFFRGITKPRVARLKKKAHSQVPVATPIFMRGVFI